MPIIETPADYNTYNADIWRLTLQWYLYITDKEQELLSAIWRCPLLGGFIIAWVWLVTKIDDAI